MDVRFRVIFSVGLFALFFILSPHTLATGSITTCPGEPAVYMHWGSSSCTSGPTITSGVLNCNSGAVASSGSSPVANGTSCTATINCSNSGVNAAPDNATLNYDTTQIWNGTQCVPNQCSNGANNPPACNSCPAGYSWNGSSCVQVINGSCGATHYNCNSGTSVNQVAGATNWTWTCQGSNGGSNASCSEAVPGAPSCTSVGPQAPVAYYPANSNPSGTFYVYAYGVQNATSVYFPTWGDLNGQNDLVWYAGTNLGGGTWRATVNLANHAPGSPEYGNMNTHVYMNSASYSNVWCNAMNWTLQSDYPVCSGGAPSAQVTLGTSGSFRVYAYGVSGNATSVYFPTWGYPNGQNDLVWYAGTNAGGGTWYADVNLGNHVAGNPEYGTFETDVYMNTSTYSNVGCVGYTWSRVNNNASCVSLSAPASVGVGQTFSATVVMNNNGTSNWTQASQYKLGSQPQDNRIWGLSRVLLPVSSVSPGQNATFTFNATAPATAGTYPFGWAMLEEGVQWFGGTCTQNIVVNNAPSGSISASPNPCFVAQGATTCSTGVTWNISNASSPNAFSSYTNSQFSTAASGSNVSQSVPFAGTSFSARDGSTILASTPANAVCANGLAYSGGTCVACSNGGCTGSGGGPNNPLGTLACNNGATNPPSCVVQPTAALSGNPLTIVTGQAATLSWSSTNASMCGAAGGGTWLPYGSATSGNVNVTPSTTSSYQTTCLSPSGGSANSNIVTITVLQPTDSITATPSRVHAGQSTTIAWTSTNATSCTVSGPGFSKTGLSGSQSVPINSQSTYTLNCNTTGPPLPPKTVTVNIIPDFQEF